MSTLGKNTSRPLMVSWSLTRCSQLLRVQRTYQRAPPTAWGVGIVLISGKASPPSVRQNLAPEPSVSSLPSGSAPFGPKVIAGCRQVSRLGSGVGTVLRSELRSRPGSRAPPESAGVVPRVRCHLIPRLSGRWLVRTCNAVHTMSKSQVEREQTPCEREILEAEAHTRPTRNKSFRTSGLGRLGGH